MELTIKETLQKGVAAHNAGNLQEAERLYRSILQSQPEHPDANHNLGVLAVSVNKADVALPLFKSALAANPKIEQFWLSYIDALIKEQQFDNAKKVLEQAKNQGVAGDKVNALEAQLKHITQSALPKLSQKNKKLTFKEKRQNVSENKQQKKKTKGNGANTLNPSQSQINNLLEHYQSGQYTNAEKLAVSITEQFPTHPFAWKVLGAVLKQTGRVTESLTALQKSVQLAPQDAEAHSNLGVTLQELGRLDEAEASCRQAIALKPDYELAHYNLGVTLQELGRLDEAEASYTQAIALKHNYPDALFNRWHLLFDKGEFDAALKDSDLDIYVGAKEHSLITLYALGRIEEVYKKIEIHSKMDSENIGISAFAAFVAESEKKPTAYNFCPNPIDFIHVSNISSHLEDSTEFVREVIEELHNVKTIWEPSGKATRKGFVTDKKFNLFASSSGKLAQLKAIIFDEIDAYYLKFQEESCTYIKKWPSEISLFGWHIVLKQQGYNTPHIHPSGWLSGVIYLKVVPSLGKDEGAIEFSLNGEHYSDLNSPKIVHQPELGDLVFFPSSLHHRTIPFTTDTDRIIVSFDLMPPNFVG